MKHFAIILGQRLEITEEQFHHFRTWHTNLFMDRNTGDKYVMVYGKPTPPTKEFDPSFFEFQILDDVLNQSFGMGDWKHIAVPYREEDKL